MKKTPSKASADIEVTTWVGGIVSSSADPTKAFKPYKAHAKAIAQKLAAFISSAKNTVSIAIYDFRLQEPEADIVIGAINAQAEKGVLTRIAYFAQPATTSNAKFQASGGDPAPGTDAAFLGRLHARVQKRAVDSKTISDIAKSVGKEPIDGRGHLMHSKYVVVDSMSPAGAVWMGSANFTTDAWTVQDNNVVIVRSQDISGYYATDFNELWDAKRITGSGKDDLGSAHVDGTIVDAAFSPGEGATIDHDIAGFISAAQERVAIASMVISSANVLGALQDALDRGVELSGIYDGPEMAMVEKDWSKGANSAGKLALWNTVKSHLVAKASLSYDPKNPSGVHNFMHNKCMAVDGALAVTGSFNFSQNATHNAENVLTFHDPEIAAQFEAYIALLVKTYGK